MPITEEQLFSLLNAGEQLEQLLLKQQSWLIQLATNPPLDEQTQEPNAYALLFEINSAAQQFPIPREVQQILIEERVKRKLNHVKAQKMKLYMQGKRALARGEAAPLGTVRGNLERKLAAIYQQDELERINAPRQTILYSQPTTQPPNQPTNQPTNPAPLPIRAKGQKPIIPPRIFTEEELAGVIKPEDVNLDSLGTEE